MHPSEYCFKTISIFSGIDKPIVTTRLNDGRITGCGPCVPPLTESNIETSARIVAQAGPEPFLDAMEANPDFNVIVGGRAYDPAPYSAFATYHLRKKYGPAAAEDMSVRGGFTHMGKIMECGGLCAKPKSHTAIATVYSDGTFDVWPGSTGSKCTPQSVAAHALYENTRPDFLRGPGGVLELADANYEQLPDGRTVRVSGSKLRTSQADGKPYQIKLEAAHIVGHRSLFMGRLRDRTFFHPPHLCVPRVLMYETIDILISKIDTVLASVKAYVQEQHSNAEGNFDLDFHVYGKDQQGTNGPGELFVVAEALASTQQLANSVASKARIGMIVSASSQAV